MTELRGKSNLLRRPNGGFRSGWRIALWLVAVFALAAIVDLLLPPAGLIARASVLCLILVALSLLAWKWLDRRRPSATPLAPTKAAVLRAAYGFMLGIAVVAMIVAILAATGSIGFDRGVCDVGQAGAYLARTVVLFLLAATVEELLFRGYGLFALQDGVGRPAAVFLSAALFSLIHVSNPHYTIVAGINLALVGIVLGFWVLRVGSVWGAVGLHSGWNWTLGGAAALPVSGLRFPAPCYAGRLEGAEWATGGSFGLEASLVTTAAWLIIGGFLYRKGALNG